MYEAEDAEHWDNGVRDDDADAAMCPFHPACWQAIRPAAMAALLRRNTRAYSYGHVDDRFSKKSKFGNGIRCKTPPASSPSET